MLTLKEAEGPEVTRPIRKLGPRAKSAGSLMKRMHGWLESAWVI